MSCQFGAIMSTAARGRCCDGVSACVCVRLSNQLFPGRQLQYTHELTSVVGSALRFPPQEDFQPKFGRFLVLIYWAFCRSIFLSRCQCFWQNRHSNIPGMHSGADVIE